MTLPTKLGCSGLATRVGLTLLELLVVLTILIALGGIVVASLPGLLGRTQVATAAANVPEIDRALRGNLVVRQGQIGNRFDSLIAGSGGLSGQVADYIGGSESFEVLSLTESDLTALAKLGITELVPAQADAVDATFSSHDQQPVALTKDANVCAVATGIADDVMRHLWNLEPAEGVRYILLGLGSQCTLVGAGPEALFSDAPVHFSDDSLSSPKNMYSRYIVIVELDSSNELMSRARYVGTAIPHQTGLVGIADKLSEFYTSQ